MNNSIIIEGLGTGHAVMRPLSLILDSGTGTPVADPVGTAEGMAREGGLVILTSNERDHVAAASGLSGVIPVLVGAAGNPLADAGLVRARNLAALAPLAQETAAILQLARFRPSDFRARQQAAIAALCQAITAAGGIMVYGAGNIGRQAVDAARRAGLPVAAVLDANASRHGTLFEGVEIRPPQAIEPGRSVVVPALGRAVGTVKAHLRALGVRDIMSLSQLYALSRRPGEPETDYLDDLYANRWRYLSLYCMVADDRSRVAIDAIIRHRLTLETEPCAGICEHDHPQWFDPSFLPRRLDDVFVDAGAHDGDTVEGYIKAQGDGFRHIDAFELDPVLVETARRRIGDDPRVRFHTLGLSNGPGEVCFRPTGGTDGTIAVTPGEGTRVRLGSIDDHVTMPATYIKIDVEGMEALVLEGARRQIATNRPMLGVAAYHKAQDLWDLPRRILDIDAGYRIHFRHYTDVAYETVLYAQP